jgi:hypothetical protein
MLSFIHSRRVAHDLMVLAVLAMEIFFAWRASLMYVFILTGRVNAYELEVVRWLVFLAVGVFGFALATHRHAGVDAIRSRKANAGWSSLAGLFLAAGIVILHDVAATIYTVGSIDSFASVVAVVGMCFLVFLPFLVGYMSHSIAAGIEEENAQHAHKKIARWQQKAELRYWKKHYRRTEFVPASTALPVMEKPLAPELDTYGSLAALFPNEKTLTIRAHANGHTQGGDAADDTGSPFHHQ